MKNKMLISGIVLLGILSCGCLVQNTCVASELTETQLSSIDLANVNNTEMERYIRLARRSIKNYWYPPTSSFENSAVLGLTIDRKGQLLNCAILKSSQDEGFDNSLLEAAKKAKYAPLPKDFIEDAVDLSLEFGMQRRHVTK